MSLSGVPDSDLLVFLGDFNARLGMRDSSRDPFGLVRDPHGHGSVNVLVKSYFVFSIPVM